MTISLCMIVKNEEDVLARALDSIKDAVDEIIIVDTGSTDKTKEIASKYTNKIYDFEWINDFSAARNFAFSKATMDYQMWLDADDVFPPESLRKLIKLKKIIMSDVEIVTMPYVVDFDSEGRPTVISTRERILKRENQYKWIEPVHECIPLQGNIFNSDIEVWHKKERANDCPGRNLKIYESLEAKGKPMTARQQYYFARELKDHQQWAKATYYFEMFLAGKQGWFEDNIATCFNLSVCYKLLNREEKILPVLIKSFEYDAPRAEILSEIGYFHKNKNDFKTALKWFVLAANQDKPDSLGFLLKDYWGYIPSIEACVCYSELGDYKNAMIYNERAAKIYPEKLAVSINKKFLLEKLKGK